MVVLFFNRSCHVVINVCISNSPIMMYRPLSLFFAFVRLKGGDSNAIVLLEKKGKKRKGMKQVYVKKALFLLFDVMQELEYGFFLFFSFCVGKV